jgi:diguanylate cyclase (GGDEF)-like protein/PAS domain S-box-containing protein
VLLDWLPRGQTLSADVWLQRHRWLLAVLWLHVPVLVVFGAAQGKGVLHSICEASLLAFFALLGSHARERRKLASGAVSIGMLVCSALLVHFANGVTEAHFHFFVMISLLTLYEDWTPFLLAIGFVGLHHGLGGAMGGHSVFMHPGSSLSNWGWAGIHAGFVTAASAANVLAWRLNEDTRKDARRMAAIVESSHDAIVSFDPEGTIISWNPGAEALSGFAAADAVGRPTADFVPAALGMHVRELLSSARAIEPFEAELPTRDGDLVPVSVSLSPVLDPTGRTIAISAIVHDIGERKRHEAAILASQQALSHQALHDALTGLPNRTLLNDRLERAQTRARRSGKPPALLFLDIDHFKVINDSLGHASGDQLLVGVAERLDGLIRGSDTIARFGGDEFAVLCEDLTETQAIELAERVLAAFKVPFALDDRQLHVSVSVGVALAKAADDAEALVRDADAAMYRAKERGRARVELFDSEMRERALERMTLESELRHAIAEDELVLLYQPIVGLADGEVGGAEALVRWRHPQRGLLGPHEFIPLAEETGLIVSLGAWVIDRACEKLAEWERTGRGELGLAVNVSARQFTSGTLVETVQDALARTGIDPARLSIELTESVLMEFDAVAETLTQLKGLGVRLMLDDFGTGYSSLSYLSRFPLDGLKVDRSFVANIGTASPDQAIVAAVATMADAMNLRVVAEGVETPEQRTELSRLGYRHAQGYLFAKPLPSEEFPGAVALPVA